MTHYIWQVSDQAPLVRIAMAAVWAYFVATVAASAFLAGMSLFTDWAFAADYGSSIMFFVGLGCVIWYPMAQLIAFRAPAGSWESIGFVALINILLITVFMMVADGLLFQTALALFVATSFVIGGWRRSRREAPRPGVPR